MRSLCPWDYTIGHDPERYPSSIPQARPRCRKCVGLETHSEYECHLVYRDITVLRRKGCIDGVYVYAPEIQSIAVASLCAQRVVVK